MAMTRSWAQRHLTLARSVPPLLPLVALALAVSFYALPKQSLWLDEAFSVALARLDWPGMWRVIAPGEANMGLYYVLLHFWLRLGMGTSELGVRSLSALLAAATVVPVFGLGNRLLGRKAAILACVLLVINAFFVQYGAQEARGYALAMLLVTTSSYLFVRALDRPAVPNWAAYVAVGALSLYAHSFSVWVVIAHFVAVLLIGGRRGLALQALIAQALIAALATPLVVPIFTTQHLGWLKKPSWQDLVSFAGEFTGQADGDSS